MPDTGVTDKHIFGAGRIFEFVHGAEEGPPVITPANLSAIVNVLQESIGDEPHVAEKVSLNCAYVMHSMSLRKAPCSHTRFFPSSCVGRDYLRLTRYVCYVVGVLCIQPVGSGVQTI